MFYQDGKQNVFMKHLHHFCRDYSKMENVRGTSPCVKDMWVFLGRLYKCYFRSGLLFDRSVIGLVSFSLV